MTNEMNCPFCGGLEVQIESADFESAEPDGDAEVLFVSCHSCGANGPAAINETTAVQLWKLAPRHKATMSITGDSLVEIFHNFSQIVTMALKK